MYRFMLRSLWCVVKGLAVAPPGIMFIIGVSTYTQHTEDSTKGKQKPASDTASVSRLCVCAHVCAYLCVRVRACECALHKGIRRTAKFCIFFFHGREASPAANKEIEKQWQLQFCTKQM